VFVSPGESVGLDDIKGVLNLTFKFSGCVADLPKVPSTDCESKDVVDLLAGVGAVAEERGSGSSRETIDMSSPLNRSPSWCLFYLL
jgi:hypothetical protein